MASGINLGIFAKFHDKGLKDAESALAKTAGAVARIGGAAAAAAGAAGLGLLTSALTKGFERLQSIDDATNKLQGLGHSAESVQTIMDSALASVKGTAYGLGDAATIAASAVAAGIKPGQELTKYLTLTADAASIAGVSLEEMGNVMNNVRTIGAAYNDSLQIMAQKGIPIYTMLADELGITTDAVKDLASEGGISADLFEQVMRDKFGGAALKAGETVRGSFENMQAALGRLGAALLGTTFEGLPDVLTQITDLFDSLLPQFEEIGKVVGPVLIDTFKQLMTAITPLLAPFMQLITSLLPPIAALIQAIVPVIVALVNAFMPLIEAVLPILVDLIVAIIEPLAKFLVDLLTPLIPIVIKLVEAFAPLVDRVLAILIDLLNMLLPIFLSLIDKLLPILDVFILLADPILDVIEALLPLVEAILPPLIELLLIGITIFSEYIKEHLPEIKKGFEDFGEVVKWISDYVIAPFVGFIKDSADRLADLLDGLKKLFGYNGKSVQINANMPGIRGRGYVPGQADGGITTVSGLSWVGEEGPELLNLPRGAQVIPLDRMGSMGGGNNIVINVSGGLDSSSAIGEAVVNAIRRYERTSGQVFVRA